MEKKSKSKKVTVIVICILALALIQTLPVFFVKPLGSKSIIDKNIHLYYQAGEEKGANEVFELLKNKSEEIRTKMNF